MQRELKHVSLLEKLGSEGGEPGRPNRFPQRERQPASTKRFGKSPKFSKRVQKPATRRTDSNLRQVPLKILRFREIVSSCTEDQDFDETSLTVQRAFAMTAAKVRRR
jgi:hypothetical protein